MTTLTYCTYTVSVRDLAAVAALGRKLRTRGGRRTTATDYRTPRDMWRDHVMLSGCTAYAGDPYSTFATYAIGAQRDTLLVAVPYDIITAAAKGRRNQTVIIHSDGRLECGDDTVYTWSVPTVEIELPVDVAEVELAHVVSILAPDFQHMVSVTTPSASADDSRPTLTGVCLTTSMAHGIHTVQAAATDSYRLTACECAAFDIATEDSTVISARALRVAASVKCDAYTVERNDTYTRIAPSVSGPMPHPVRIYTERMTGAFPNVDALWPETHGTAIEVDADAFARTMRAAYDTAKDAPATLHVESGDTLRVTVKNREVTGEWFVPMYWSDIPEDFIIGVSSAFALDAAEAIIAPGVERFRISMNTPLKPMLFTVGPNSELPPVSGPARRRRVLLMPIRT